MKTKSICFILTFLMLCCLAFSLPLALHAQPGLPGGSGGPPQTAPIGGIEIFAAIGGAYAVKKLWKKENQR